MKRLLCIVNAMDAGGAETFLMKVYRALDKSKYQIDFCVSSETPGFYDEEIQASGGRFFFVPHKSVDPIGNFIGIYKLVKSENYMSVMRMSAHALSTLDLLAAKMAGAKKVILRSTSTQNDGGRFLHSVFAFMPKIVPNVKIAPSVAAAEFTFGRRAVADGKVNIINNAIPLDKYTFSEQIRYSIRKEYGIENKFVIGNIGRFFAEKNHLFLIDIFAEVIKKNQNAVLMLVGDGELRAKIEEKIDKLGLQKYVILTGVKSNVNELLMAMDVIAFPSLYEGMPNAIIEAQATGLNCVISSTITKEANITGCVKYVALDENAAKWAEIISRNRTINDRSTNVNILKQKGYDILDVANQFADIVYCNPPQKQ